MLLTENLNNIIRQQYFDTIILDTDWNYCCEEIDQYYTRIDDEIFQDANAFYPVTGWSRRPTVIYVANRLKQ